MDKGHVYLAAPWIDKDLMEGRARFFERAGYRITHRWWLYEGESQEQESPEFLSTCGKQDIMGVITADTVVVFNTAKSEGKAVEQGIAIGRNIPIIVIGQRGAFSKNVFHYITEHYTWVNTIEEALLVLEDTIE